MTAVILTKSVLASQTPDTEVYDLPDEMAAKFDLLSNTRYARMELEKKEKAIKAEILATLPARKKGVKFVLRVAGVVRANVSLRGRTNVSAKALAEAFPEAYNACASETTYDVVDPA